MAATRRLLLVRHGLPDYRGGKSGDEPPGPPLSEIGHDQVAQAVRVLRRFQPEVIYCSPLARAAQTAEHIAGALGLSIRRQDDLREWHRTERLYEVSGRATRWLVGWLRSGQTCAVVVGHASPLLAILRSALYLPQVGWHKMGCPDRLELSSGDRFEVSMASVFELCIEPGCVTARCVFHPHPRIQHHHRGSLVQRLPRPVPGSGENRVLRRPNRLHLVGYRADRERV